MHGQSNIKYKTIVNFELRHPRCVGSITKNSFITHTVEHNYISPSSTVGIQLHPLVTALGHGTHY